MLHRQIENIKVGRNFINCQRKRKNARKENFLDKVEIIKKVKKIK